MPRGKPNTINPLYLQELLKHEQRKYEELAAKRDQLLAEAKEVGVEMRRLYFAGHARYKRRVKCGSQ